MTSPLALHLPPELLQAVATAVADELERRGALGAASGIPSPWLDVDEAASYLRASRQRVYDLVHAQAIEPARDGRRLLFRREALDNYLVGATAEDVAEARRAA